MSYKPSLRPLDIQPVYYKDQQMWLLRDPLQLTDHQLIVPALLAQMLIFCDGTRTPEEIHESFCRHIGGEVEFKVITEALDQLDVACLLENKRSRRAHQSLLAAYRDQPNRPPALADIGYPSSAPALSSLLQHYSRDDELDGWPDWRGRGIVSPHIDYQRGGEVYAKVWRRARAAVLEADLVLIFGTDHNGSPGSLTLTRQPYATPFGELPTQPVLLDELAESLGSEAAFAEELHHRSEHSIELSAVWLNYIYHQSNQQPSPMLPILCGPYHHFLANGVHPTDDHRLTAAVDTLRRATTGKKVLAVASVDLSHVGPSFGDGFPMDKARRTRLAQSDRQLINAILSGDALAFHDQISAVQDRNRICGYSSIFIMLRYLGLTEGVEIAYEHCPADAEDMSLVSICGLLLQ